MNYTLYASVMPGAGAVSHQPVTLFPEPQFPHL